jgi:ATPase subunit of ABC transporter with duplicated ATPase domains
MSDDRSSLLCITGDMGSGKSVLMSYLVEQIKPLIGATRHIGSPKVTVSSFFCDDKDVGRRYGQAVFRCLLYQILRQRHDLVEHATARFSEMVPERSASDKTHRLQSRW